MFNVGALVTVSGTTASRILARYTPLLSPPVYLVSVGDSVR